MFNYEALGLLGGFKVGGKCKWSFQVKEYKTKVKKEWGPVWLANKLSVFCVVKAAENIE